MAPSVNRLPVTCAVKTSPCAASLRELEFDRREERVPARPTVRMRTANQPPTRIKIG